MNFGSDPAADALLLEAVACHRDGRRTEAEALYRALLAARPNHAAAHHNLGVLLIRSGQAEQGLPHLTAALAADPACESYWLSLIETQAATGRIEEALTLLQRGVRHGLASPAVEALARRLRQQVAGLGQSLFITAIGHQEAGRLADAEALYHRLLALDPHHPGCHHHLGLIAHRLGRNREVAAAIGLALALQPDDAAACSSLGVVLRGLGRPEEAAVQHRRSLALRPAQAAVLNNLGVALCDLGRLEEAVTHYRQALEIEPESADAHDGLGSALQRLTRPEQAAAQFRTALIFSPDHVGARVNLATLLPNQNRTEEAVRLSRQVLAVKPNHSHAHSNLIFTLDLMAGLDTAAQQAERRRWNDRHAAPFRTEAQRGHANRPDPDRRLRVGYVSADFRTHSASAIFAAAVLNHDPAQIEVVCYANAIAEDEMTARFRAAAALWRPVAELSDAALAEQVRADAIDILVDLSGHTAGNRLLVFARKPAPLQVTAWGHATGTGLAAIDAFLADPVLVPPAERGHFAERVVDLPSALGYQPPAYAPPVAPLPALAGGAVTFGCFNRISKITAATLEVWREVLRRCPGSILMIKAATLSEPQAQADFIRHCLCHGIPAERLILLGGDPHPAYLAAHGRVDLMLDPFPHAGGTSTLEALWMGVPVLTLSGATPVSRNGASILTALGLEDWIAADEAGYAAKAAAFAADLPRLAELRQSLRPRMAAGPLGNPPLFARSVEAAYRRLWRDWCRRHMPPAQDTAVHDIRP